MKDFIMRVTNLTVITILSLIMIIMNARAENNQKRPVSILLGRPVNISEPLSDQWIAALIQTILEYKLSAVNNITFVPDENIRRYIPSHTDYTLTPYDVAYLPTGTRMNADYVATQKFEMQRGKKVSYYMEVAATSSQEVVATIEHTFKLHSLGNELNVIVQNLLNDLNLSPPSQLTRFMKLPAVGTDLGVLEKLGGYIIRERFSRMVDSIPLADDYRTFCEKEQSMELAYYQAGRFFLALGRHNDAVEALTFLFRSTPEYSPVYAPLMRALRMAGRNQNIQQIIEFAEKWGITSSEFNLEKARYYQTTGNIEKAEYVYRQILMSNPEDRNALRFYAQYYEK